MGSKMSVVALVHVVAVFGRQLEEELAHGQGAQDVRARLGNAQQEGGFFFFPAPQRAASLVRRMSPCSRPLLIHVH